LEFETEKGKSEKFRAKQVADIGSLLQRKTSQNNKGNFLRKRNYMKRNLLNLENLKIAMKWKKKI